MGSDSRDDVPSKDELLGVSLDMSWESNRELCLECLDTLEAVDGGRPLTGRSCVAPGYGGPLCTACGGGITGSEAPD